ncbi:biopolymer transport protein ExbD/TolR [Salinisphaera sp. PC39]|uniref:ExbD/TolR family protein n=1 Tax=Salinisphaera sp. PC39 TaxID=1304156 RepID=UPI003342D69B
MRLPRSRSEDPQLNLTSLIDVVFLLLIFFMVTTTFVPHAGLQLRLPEAAATPAETEGRPLDVSIDAADRIYVDGEPVRSEPAALRARLSARAGDDAGRGVRIRADGRASHQAVVSVMDAAAALGLARVEIVTRPAEEGR